jgi:uncharacterized membrane protein YgcG
VGPRACSRTSSVAFGALASLGPSRGAHRGASIHAGALLHSTPRRPRARGDGDGGSGDEGPPSPSGGAAAAAQAARPQQLCAALWRRVPPQATLRIAYLACHLMREAVTPADILDWAATGQLPYFELPAIAAAAAAEEAAAAAAAGDVAAAALPPLPAMCVRPQIWDTPARLAAHAQSLAARLGLPPLPPANGEALLRRAALDLGVPPGVAAVARALLQAHGLGRRELELPAGAPPHHAAMERPGEAAQPHVLCVALLVVALKMVYGLGRSGGGGGGGGGGDGDGGAGAGGRGRLAAPGAPPPPASWQAWAARTLVRLQAARGRVPASAAEVRHGRM